MVNWVGFAWSMFATRTLDPFFPALKCAFVPSMPVARRPFARSPVRPFARSPAPARTASHAFPPFPSGPPRCASTFHPWLARIPPPHRLRTELSYLLLGTRWRSTHTLSTLLLPAYLRRDHLLHALRAGDEEMYARKVRVPFVHTTQ
ncbi:hypothetical protein C8R44DRAFT_946211 [Mycena epipterygia]|nr:hypothetical protein C8R44DRAFT_946211 [Mycena epipterygia]